jgi:CubicO group peptidase (beta-lactamase class C family)
VLGLVVEAISGKSLSAFLDEHIWKPLGMVDTGFTIPDTKQARYALAFPNDPLTNTPQSVPAKPAVPTNKRWSST